MNARSLRTTPAFASVVAYLGRPVAGVDLDPHRARTGSGPVVRREPARDEGFDDEPASQAHGRHDEQTRTMSTRRPRR